MRRFPGLALVAAVGCLLLACGSASAAIGDVTEFSTGITGSSDELTLGPDGNIWFTEFAGRIGSITPAGVVTEFGGITAGQAPQGIVTGPDGALWFVEQSATAPAVGRITTSGTVTEYTAGITPTVGNYGIAAGPDGNLWFPESNPPGIGQITTTGTVTEFQTGLTPGADLWNIDTGSDGNMWFTEQAANRIGRITMTGVITEFTTGLTGNPQPSDIVAGPDGNLWFTELGTDKIGRITTAGVITEFGTGITPGAQPSGITAGPDGALWFTEYGIDRIGRITTSGVVTEYGAGSIAAGAGVNGIAVGSDNNIWFTEANKTTIGRMIATTTTPPATPTAPPSDPAPTDSGGSSAPPAPLPPPVFAKTVNVERVSGTVLVKTPGAASFTGLTSPTQVAVGTIVDARKGRVRLFTVDSKGRVQSAEFYEGIFRVVQLAKDKGITQLNLITRSRKLCKARRAVDAAGHKPRSLGHLWGSGKGLFRTKGRYASATIRGTTWDTDDRCDGTLVRVAAGAVAVRDFPKRRTITLKAPRTYLAKRPRR